MTERHVIALGVADLGGAPVRARRDTALDSSQDQAFVVKLRNAGRAISRFRPTASSVDRREVADLAPCSYRPLGSRPPSRVLSTKKNHDRKRNE